MVQLKLSDVSKYFTEATVERGFKLKTISEDEIQNIVVTRAAPAGEGLISAVYRIHVTGKYNKESFVVKAIVKDELLRKTLYCADYFNREINFFTKILPMLIEVQKATGAKERIQNTIPICYSYYSNNTDDYLLMEDLSESNCSAISKIPTKYERDITLKALAHLHSVSMVLRIKKPDIFKTIAHETPEIYYREDKRRWYAKYLQNAIDIDKIALAEYEDPSTSNIYKKFNDLIHNDPYGQMINLASTWSDYPVLNHGDAWCPNFMCSKERAVAIDFQLVRFASPINDLSYFIMMCSNLCCNKEDFLTAVRTYYNFLEYFLNDMGIDAKEAFSWETLVEEMKKYGKFGILASLTSIPLMASEKCDVLQSFEAKYSGLTRIPLEDLWSLTPLKSEDVKMRLVNTVRVAVDVGLI